MVDVYWQCLRDTQDLSLSPCYKTQCFLPVWWPQPSSKVPAEQVTQFSALNAPDSLALAALNVALKVRVSRFPGTCTTIPVLFLSKSWWSYLLHAQKTSPHHMQEGVAQSVLPNAQALLHTSTNQRISVYSLTAMQIQCLASTEAVLVYWHGGGCAPRVLPTEQCSREADLPSEEIVLSFYHSTD